MKIPKGGVGFFDSGIGGLTVLSECRKLLPDLPFYYYGDNRHAPYGNLSERKIRRYVLSAFKKFEKLQVSAVVLACNTVTALMVEELRKIYSFPIIGAEPAVFSAAKNGGKVFVLTTRATYNSQRFQLLCQRASVIFPHAEILPIACDCMAGAIEQNIFDESFRFSMLLPSGTPDAVVLGCTHYIYIRKQIEAFYGCKVYDGNMGIANQLRKTLEKEQANAKKRSEDEIFREEKPLLTTTLKRELNTESFSQENIEKIPQNEGLKGLYFLGSGKRINKKVHKRMFAFK